MPPCLQDQRIEFRIGIHVGDVIFDDNDIFGDGVNIAARLEGIAEPGGVCMSDDAYRQVRGKVEIACDDMGPQPLKNIAEPMRAWRVRLTGQTPSAAQSGSAVSQSQVLPLPDKPSIAVLPFQNMSGDPEQEYFADGMVEDIITALSRFRSLLVIARNSSFTYKGKAVDVKQVGRELGVRYVLEGSVRRRTMCVSPRSSSIPQPGVTYGPRNTTATSPTSLKYRTKSRAASWARPNVKLSLAKGFWRKEARDRIFALGISPSAGGRKFTG